MIKKRLVVMVLLAAVAGLGFAQVQGFTIGARIIGVIPFYSSGSDIYNSTGGRSANLEGKFGFGFAGQASYNFSDLLGAQVEIIYNSDDIKTNVLRYDVLGYTGGTVKASSLLIPVLFRVGTTLNRGVQLTGIGGIYFTVPLGDAEVNDGYYKEKVDWNGSIGAMLGGIVGYRVGPGSIFADVRYAFDFSDVKINSYKYLKKSGIHIGLGYSIPIGSN